MSTLTSKTNQAFKGDQIMNSSSNSTNKVLSLVKNKLQEKYKEAEVSFIGEELCSDGSLSTYMPVVENKGVAKFACPYCFELFSDFEITCEYNASGYIDEGYVTAELHRDLDCPHCNTSLKSAGDTIDGVYTLSIEGKHEIEFEIEPNGICYYGDYKDEDTLTIEDLRNGCVAFGIYFYLGELEETNSTCSHDGYMPYPSHWVEDLGNKLELS